MGPVRVGEVGSISGHGSEAGASDAGTSALNLNVVQARVVAREKHKGLDVLANAHHKVA